jgi:hypothetical protein
MNVFVRTSLNSMTKRRTLEDPGAGEESMNRLMKNDDEEGAGQLVWESLIKKNNYN